MGLKKTIYKIQGDKKGIARVSLLTKQGIDGCEEAA